MSSTSSPSPQTVGSLSPPHSSSSSEHGRSRQSSPEPTSPTTSLLEAQQTPPTSPVRSSPPSTGDEILYSSESDDAQPSAKRTRMGRDKDNVSLATLRRREGAATVTLNLPPPENFQDELNDRQDTMEHALMDILECASPFQSVLSNSSGDKADSSSQDMSTSEVDSDNESSSSETRSEASSRGQSDSNDSDDDDDRELFTNSMVSRDEAILGLMEIHIKQRWSKSSLSRTLAYVRSLLPESHEMPSSVYNILKYVESLAPPPSVNKHVYCKECHHTKVDNLQACNNCESTQTGEFFEFCLKSQIKYYFEHRNLSVALDSYSTVEAGQQIADMKDGIEYKKVKIHLKGDYDLLLLWNTDGVQMSKSSKVKIWPVLCTISQLPPHLRSSFLIVAGIWCDTKDPDMNVYLKPFVESLKEIYQSGGVEWTHPQTKSVLKSIVVAPVLCADAPAKADVLVVKRYNSKYGCNTCEQGTVPVDLNPERQEAVPGEKRKRTQRAYVYQEATAQLRTEERMAHQATVALTDGTPCKGVLGEAIVSNIPFFDRGKGVCAEYLHLLLSGVCKYFTNLMFFVKGNWYIGDKVEEVNSFIESIKVPDFVNRCPRGFSLFKYWKASEFLFWLLYYSLPAIRNHISDEYWQHWMLLVKASFILLKESITFHELDVADILLRCFVRDVGPLYGWQYYPYNVHSLLHLRLLVERWGPLWATSAFPFENYNGVLRASLHGTKNFGQELVNNVRLIQGFHVLKNKVKGNQQNFAASKFDSESQI